MYRQKYLCIPKVEWDYLQGILKKGEIFKDEFEFAVVRTWTVWFNSSLAMDIKVCNASKPSGAWCEGVLYDDECEVGCTDVMSDLDNLFIIKLDDIEYIVQPHADGELRKI